MKFDILSNEELTNAYLSARFIRGETVGERDRTIAQAEQKHTLKQVIEWGEEECPHHFNHPAYTMRRECRLCWEDIQKEIDK